MKENLIILPGWAGNKFLWEHQCKNLVGICDPKVIVIHDQDTADKMADAVLKQAPEQFILVGHSLGGWIAQHIALKALDRVKKLVLIGTWTGPTTPEFIDLFKKNLQRIKDGDTKALLDELRPRNVFPERQTDAPLMQKIENSQAQFPETGMIKQLEVVLNGGDTASVLHQIKCPTLIIHGRYDAFFSVSEAAEMAAKIPHAKLTIIEECGHLPSIEQPQAVTALLRLWIQYN